MWIWTESTGSNYNIIGSVLSTATATGASAYFGGSTSLLPFNRRIYGLNFSQIYG
jgi:hypothetical protein